MIFLRHPTPDVTPGTCYGRLDMDIAEVGHGEIDRALALTPPARHIIASPALRCRKLALQLAERDRLTPQFDERLWEMHMGDWEGLKWADLDRSKSNRWLEDPLRNRTPGGEAFADLMSRVVEVVAEMPADTAIVCHAGPIRAIWMAWEGLTFKQAFARQPAYAEPIEIHPPE